MGRLYTRCAFLRTTPPIERLHVAIVGWSIARVGSTVRDVFGVSTPTYCNFITNHASAIDARDNTVSFWQSPFIPDLSRIGYASFEHRFFICHGKGPTTMIVLQPPTPWSMFRSLNQQMTQRVCNIIIVLGREELHISSEPYWCTIRLVRPHNQWYSRIPYLFLSQITPYLEEHGREMPPFRC